MWLIIPHAVQGNFPLSLCLMGDHCACVSLSGFLCHLPFVMVVQWDLKVIFRCICSWVHYWDQVYCAYPTQSLITVSATAMYRSSVAEGAVCINSSRSCIFGNFHTITVNFHLPQSETIHHRHIVIEQRFSAGQRGRGRAKTTTFETGIGCQHRDLSKGVGDVLV